MQLSRSELMTAVKNACTEDELRESIVYIIPNLEAGEEITINRKAVKISSPSSLLFIDLEPRANWSHACRYLIISKTNNALKRIDAQFPPAVEKLQLFQKPENAEDWMLLTDKDFQ